MTEIKMLEVNTLGEFAMKYDGVKICGVRSGDSQFNRLMQVLLHYRERGVSRMELQELLFEDSRADDVHHLLRSVIYNARKRLRQAGLPESKYIEYKGGHYYWTDDIPVSENAREFESKCTEARNETDLDDKLRKLMEAVHMYQGDFLPSQTWLSWVARESERYRNLFAGCVDEASELFRDKHDYHSMETLGRYASSVCPLSEWETLTMEGLLGMGRQREAHDLYSETAKYYQDELGVLPPIDMMSKMEGSAGRAEQPFASPEEIIQNLDDYAAKSKGGLFCSFPVFQGIYSMFERSLDRYGLSSYLLVVTVDSADGSGKLSDGLTERLSETLCDSVRQSDIVCRYGKRQFLVLLMNRYVESCEIVRDRVDRNFKAVNPRIRTSYHISQVKMFKLDAE